MSRHTGIDVNKSLHEMLLLFAHTCSVLIYISDLYIMSIQVQSANMTTQKEKRFLDIPNHSFFIIVCFFRTCLECHTNAMALWFYFTYMWTCFDV